jgi:hypothetical protein
VYPGAGYVDYVFFFRAQPGIGVIPGHSAKIGTTNGKGG